MMSTAVLRRRSYDVAVVEVYSGKAFLWGEALSLLLSTLRCPFVLILHGGALPDFARRYPERVRKCLSRATAVISPSHYLKTHLSRYRPDVQLLPNPLNICAYNYRERTNPKPQLVWLRAMHAIYNPTLAIRVGNFLAADFPETHLTMVGPDKGDGSLQHVKALAEELSFARRLTLPGGVAKSEVPYWMDRGDIFLNTTNVDNTPTSVLEAMACGLCVVSTNVGGIPYLLEHEVDALLVLPNDPEAMSAAVRRLLSEPGLAARLSRNGRRKAERLDWSIILPQWRTLLTSLA